MKVTGKPIPVGVGVFFIVFGVIGAAAMLSGAKGQRLRFCSSAFSGDCSCLFLRFLGLG